MRGAWTLGALPPRVFEDLPWRSGQARAGATGLLLTAALSLIMLPPY